MAMRGALLVNLLAALDVYFGRALIILYRNIFVWKNGGSY
jgi:hypothetical protein